jgi:hypothetical protein
MSLTGITAMEEAFRLSGLVGEKEIKRREDARKEKEEKEIEQRIQHERHRKEIEHDQEIKLNEKIKPFDDRWRDPQKRKFLVHLVFAYIPADISYYPWTDRELREKKCCICEQALISKQYIFDNIKKFTSTGIDQIRRMAKGETINVRKEFEKDFGDVVMAIVSPNSSAAFCNPCYNAFFSWIEIMILRGDPQINRIIQKRQIETSLSKEQLKEYDALQKEGSIDERKKKLGEFLRKVKDGGKNV